VGKLSLLDLAILALVTEPVPTRQLAEGVGKWCSTPALIDALNACADVLELAPARLSKVPVMAFLGDWYRVKMGSDLGLDVIAPGDLATYRFLSGLYAVKEWEDGTAQAAFARLLRMFDRFTSGMPSNNFSVDLVTGDIHAR